MAINERASESEGKVKVSCVVVILKGKCWWYYWRALVVERLISDLKTDHQIFSAEETKAKSLEVSTLHIACVHSDWENQEHINTRFIKTQAGISYQIFIWERVCVFVYTTVDAHFSGDMEQTHTQLNARIYWLNFNWHKKQRSRYVFAFWLIRVGKGSSKSPCAMRKRSESKDNRWCRVNYPEKKSKQIGPTPRKWVFGGVLLIIAFLRSVSKRESNWIEINSLVCLGCQLNEPCVRLILMKLTALLVWIAWNARSKKESEQALNWFWILWVAVELPSCLWTPAIKSRTW